MFTDRKSSGPLRAYANVRVTLKMRLGEERPEISLKKKDKEKKKKQQGRRQQRRQQRNAENKK
jgi:hypothetical protein